MSVGNTGGDSRGNLDRSWDLAACSEGCTPTPPKAVFPNNTSIRSPRGKCDGLKRRVCGCFVFGDRVPSSQSVYLVNQDFCEVLGSSADD